VTAGSNYTASYVAPKGHYPYDTFYFAGSNAIYNPPLHAFSGTFASGTATNTTFPNIAILTNYWIDIVFTLTSPPQLRSIVVAPASSPTVNSGTTISFNATGHYSDNSTQLLTTTATWTSSNTTLCTISSSGIATGLRPGKVSITASFGGLTANVSSTIVAGPLIVVGGGPFNASTLANLTFSFAFQVSGGTPPFSWTSNTHSLPPGLTFSSNGTLSGTPRTSGIFLLSFNATDSTTPTKHSITTTLNLTILSGGQFTLWPSSSIPSNPDSGPDNAVELGIQFKSDLAGHVLGIRFFKASTNTGNHTAHLWNHATQASLASATFTQETTQGWQQVLFATPVAIASNTLYVASYHTLVGHYSADLHYFQSVGVNSPPLHAPVSSSSSLNGVYSYGAGSSFPGLNFQQCNYWVDVILQVP